ncbi:FecR domain-containing protein [Devosia marina]|uniref:FecR protein domain-containing protein n=1 Tax=Devosia marina TaxID=2683198 RepID=A0A7X3FUM0_9HYPH|nr:FecR domain-containing protein [Devosia marina]MVT00976.1 hypothetical protein [Devosia marina]
MAIALPILFHCFANTVAYADDWVAERLRGSVLVLQEKDWAPLQRGDIVSDDSYIKTLGNGRVTLTRGAEAIDVSGHSMIQIIDRNGEKFTNVHQHYGQIAVEAEKRDVKHFGILTLYLAAVVKGTEFVVRSTSAGASVSLDRGQVSVEDPNTGTYVEITPGQSTTVDPSGRFEVAATGGATLPVIRNADGNAVNGKPDRDSRGNGKANAGGNGNGHGNSNAGGNNNGNTGGNGSGSAGGNNNGSTGGNGNSNAGGNGNGNPGGNGKK